MLEIQHIDVIFNRDTVNEKAALKDFSLALEDGDFVTVIGSNGAGKSTVLNAIAGLCPVDSGRIYLENRDLTFLPEHIRAAHIGRVFQDPAVGTAAGMSIDENLALAMRRGQARGLRWGISRKEKEHYRVQLSGLGLGLEKKLSAQVGLLSGGQRQALAILMATLKRPKLLLLDEHTSALDPKTSLKVLEITRDLVAKHRLTTIMVTHNMRDAIAFGNRLVMLRDGRVLIDVAGKEKENLTVEKLLTAFGECGFEAVDDKLLLA